MQFLKLTSNLIGEKKFVGDALKVNASFLTYGHPEEGGLEPSQFLRLAYHFVKLF